MDKLLIVFTMKGCPFCEVFKGKLKENDLVFHERDIEEHKEEYDMFVEITENDYVPAFMIVESSNEEPNSLLFAPERDFKEISEGIDIIKKHLLV